MNMLENFLGYSFRVNYAHPICGSRKRLLRSRRVRQALLLTNSRSFAGGMLAISLVSILSLFLVIADGRTPKTKVLSSEEVLRRLSISLAGPSAREASLARINIEQNRRSASITHFISEIILKHQRNTSLSQAEKIAAAIVSESTRLGFDPLFVASLIKYESTFNPQARSPAGALGLMQMLPSTSHFISKIAGNKIESGSNLHDPVLNIRLGILYLAHLRSKFHGHKEQMLIAYNWGPENLLRSLRAGKAAPSSTTHYARRVLTHHREWAKTFDSLQSRYRHFDFARAGSLGREKSLS
jgi:hypothetical protein